MNEFPMNDYRNEPNKEWRQDYSEMSLKEMDDLVMRYKMALLDYEASDKVRKEQADRVDQIESKLMSILRTSGKQKYVVDNVGTVSLRERTTITVPHTAEDKEKLMRYIKEKYGEEALISKLTVNSRTLNSFFNEELENEVRKGNPGFRLPGCGDPVVSQTISFVNPRK